MQSAEKADSDYEYVICVSGASAPELEGAADPQS